MEQHPVKSPSLEISTRRRVGAFTLIEMLVVLAIIAILAAITLPSIQSVSASSELERGGQIVVNELAEARQMASALNATVEVRLIKTASQTGKGFGAIQIWGPNSSTGIAQPLDHVVFLPPAVAISSSTTLSKILGPLASPQTMAVGGSSAPATYVSFRIRSSGTVEPIPSLADRATLFLTLTASRLADADSPPSNYFTVQLNPDTAVTLIYRP